jgi:hypothetical protein
MFSIACGTSADPDRLFLRLVMSYEEEEGVLRSPGTKSNSGADGILDECVRSHLVGSICCPIIGTVSRGDDGRLQRDQRPYDPIDAVMEKRRPQMEATDHGVHRRIPVMACA